MMHCAHVTIHGFIGAGFHDAVNPPLPAVVPFTPHVSMQTLLGLTIKAKWSKTVIGPFGFQLLGKDNDSGLMVPHIAIPPTNVLVPIVIAFGGSKVMFGASTVKLDVDGAGVPMGACLLPFVPLSKNQACNQPLNLPTDNVIGPNTVMVGLTLGDVVGGVVNIVVDMGVSFALGKLGGGISDSITKPIVAAALNKFGSTFVSLAVGQVGEAVVNSLVDGVVGYGVGEVEGAVSGASGNAVGGEGWSDTGTALGGWIDSPDSSSSSSGPTSEASSGLINNTPGAAPIYRAG
jgi:hypothetical protein